MKPVYRVTGNALLTLGLWLSRAAAKLSELSWQLSRTVVSLGFAIRIRGDDVE